MCLNAELQVLGACWGQTKQSCFHWGPWRKEVNADLQGHRLQPRMTITTMYHDSFSPLCNTHGHTDFRIPPQTPELKHAVTGSLTERPVTGGKPSLSAWSCHTYLLSPAMTLLFLPDECLIMGRWYLVVIWQPGFSQACIELSWGSFSLHPTSFHSGVIIRPQQSLVAVGFFSFLGAQWSENLLETMLLLQGL